MLGSNSENKAETESTVANLRQEINKKQEHVVCLLNTISGNVRSNIQVWDSQIKSVKHDNDSEIMRMNNALSSLEAKLNSGNEDNFLKSVSVNTSCITESTCSFGIPLFPNIFIKIFMNTVERIHFHSLVG